MGDTGIILHVLSTERKNKINNSFLNSFSPLQSDELQLAEFMTVKEGKTAT